MSEAAALVVGVDGGGTRFRALVSDAWGIELGRADVPAARVAAGEPGPVVAAIQQAVEQACAAAGVRPPVGSLWAGIAGAGREAVRAELESALARSGLASRVQVGTDVEAAFQDAFDEGPGILLLSGTGSIAYGRGDDGRQGKVGGWGSLLGDEGSGFAIGVEAMKRVARSVDGRAPETQLRERLLAKLALADPDDLITWSGTASRPDVADLVPEVHAAAIAGDRVAGEILSRAADDLEGHVLSLLSGLGPWQLPPAVMLGGGLLQKGGPLRDRLERRLEDQQLSVLKRELDPVRGAAIKAARERVEA